MLSANIIQSGERTRLVLYLNQMHPYNIRTDGNSLLIALQGNAGSAEGLALHPAETKQDAQRRILAFEANARLKAEQEARAAEEERARRAAEAEAARIKAEEVAKAKAEAAALARKAAKAEAARLEAEQKARIKAEKEAAALAKQAAKAEAARLAAEQKARIKAEKEAAALAKQAAKQAVEAEAARLAAEQKAEAEKQAAVLAKQAAEAKVARLRAEWIIVGENKILGLTAYADPDTETVPTNGKKEKKNGDKLKMWRVYDYKTIQEASGYKFISAKFQNEYDCKEEKVRLLVNTAFSGNMGVGEVIFTNTDAGKWQPAMPGSIDEAMWKFACRKK
ncbi:MAG: hypothetical protein Q7S46_08860 [Gallionella sp.]|nr:hypothetical protein [Gallionella sp.]